MSYASTAGVHHVGLAVLDVGQTRDFFVEQLGFAQVGERPDYPAVFVSDGVVMLTLWQVEDPARAVRFDRKRCVGLHHLALRVAEQAGLDDLYGRLSAVDGVAFEFAPEPLGTRGARHMMCTIPGGVRMEFICDSDR